MAVNVKLNSVACYSKVQQSVQQSLHEDLVHAPTNSSHATVVSVFTWTAGVTYRRTVLTARMREIAVRYL